MTDVAARRGFRAICASQGTAFRTRCFILLLALASIAAVAGIEEQERPGSVVLPEVTVPAWTLSAADPVGGNGGPVLGTPRRSF